MNPEGWEEVLFSGKTLNAAIKDYVRGTKWWAYEPSNGEQIFEDIWNAVDYAEDFSDVDFDQYKSQYLK